MKTMNIKPIFFILSIFVMFFLISELVSAGTICIDKTAPTAPGNLHITDSPYDADGNITLTWTAATDEPRCSGVDHYNIYRSTNNVNFTKIGETSTLTFLDYNLVQGKTYYYRVTAVDKVAVNPHEGPYASASVTIGVAPANNNGGSNTGGSTGGATGGAGGSFGGSTGSAYNGSTGGNSCTPSWKCTNWSECSSDLVQTRNCTDINHCGTDSDKPDEIKNCTLNNESNQTSNQSGELNQPSSLPESNETKNMSNETEPKRNALTGAFIGLFGKNAKVSVGLWLMFILILLAVIAWYLFAISKKRKKRKKSKKRKRK